MNLDLTRIFVKVVQLGSFSKAAELLRMPKSTISKMVSRLERETGTKLLLRTTRSLTLTAAGRAYYETCLGPLQIIEDAQKSLDGDENLLSGLLRLTAPEDLGSAVIAPAVAELSRKHPGLQFDLQYTDRVVDLIKEGFDLAVRIGHLRESRLRAKRLSEIIMIPVASPLYLKPHPPLRKPEDLEKHAALSLSMIKPEWKLKTSNATATVHPQVKITSNHMTSLVRLAVAGAGIAYAPAFFVQEEIERGRLIRLLPDWTSQGLPVSLISPLPTNSSARLKLVSTRLSEVLQEALKCDGPRSKKG